MSMIENMDLNYLETNHYLFLRQIYIASSDAIIRSDNNWKTCPNIEDLGIKVTISIVSQFPPVGISGTLTSPVVINWSSNTKLLIEMRTQHLSETIQSDRQSKEMVK
jgi:hypothetical protein